MPRASESVSAQALTLHTAASHRAAGQVMAHYSTSFGLATRLFGQPVRTRVRSVYGLVRVVDEIVDGAAQGAGFETAGIAELLEDHQARTRAAIASGYSTDPVIHAFADVARAAGFGEDLTGPFYDSMRADLHVARHDEQSFQQYVYGSAEVVGLMCLRVFATDDADQPVTPDPALVEGARRLGAAFQKVNFLRDVADDADGRGRLYFPGVDLEHLTDADRDRLVADVRADLEAARGAVAQLPASSRVAVRACHDLYAALTDRLATVPAATLRRTRVRVPDAVKVAIVARAVARDRRGVQ